MNTLHLDLLAQRTRCKVHIANLTRMAGAETGQARALLLSAAKQVIDGMPTIDRQIAEARQAP